MQRSLKFSTLLLGAASFLIPAAAASAADRDKAFFEQAEGNWSGPGEIIAGKYKGTKFVCNFTGSTPAKNAGHHSGRRAAASASSVSQ
jgi:hypothetical protein